MIKVYVFVSGLVLYQLAPTPGGTSFAILAAGGHVDYLGLGHVSEHKATVHSGQEADTVTVAMPLEANLTVKCPEGGCAELARPQEIPWLNDILSIDGIRPKVREECARLGQGETCRFQGGESLGRNGVLEFTGNWTIRALTDCGAGYPTEEPDPAELSFVRAGRSWELRWDDETDHLSAANSVLFTTTIDEMAQLTVTHPALRAALDPSKMTDCSKLPWFDDSGAEQCAVLLVRNGSDDHYLGGGDLHFAALYGLLDNSDLEPTELWLPIAVGERACEKQRGSGCGGLIKCVGTLVTSSSP